VLLQPVQNPEVTSQCQFSSIRHSLAALTQASCFTSQDIRGDSESVVGVIGGFEVLGEFEVFQESKGLTKSDIEVG